MGLLSTPSAAAWAVSLYLVDMSAAPSSDPEDIGCATLELQDPLTLKDITLSNTKVAFKSPDGEVIARAHCDFICEDAILNLSQEQFNPPSVPCISVCIHHLKFATGSTPLESSVA